MLPGQENISGQTQIKLSVGLKKDFRKKIHVIVNSLGYPNRLKNYSRIATRYEKTDRK